MSWPTRGTRRSLLAAGVLLALPPAAAAERLPLTTYTAADGLGHDNVRCAVRDSRGLLWFCTAAGLARFDGAEFVRYGPADGLPSARVHDLAEDAAGTFWVATDRGLFVFDSAAARAAGADAGPSARPRFMPVPIAGRPSGGTLSRLLLDARGELWAVGEGGLYRLARSPRGPRLRRVGPDLPPAGDLFALIEDRSGTLWVGGTRGLARLAAGGRLAAAPSPPEAGVVRTLLEDARGELWVGGDGGLWVVPHGSAVAAGPAPPPGIPEERAAPLAVAALAGRRVRSLHQSADGTVWVGAVGGLYSLPGGDPAAPTRRYTVANGLRDETVNAMVEDLAGNLWLGTDVGGAIRLVRGGLVTFDIADGLGHTSVLGLFEGRDGALHASGGVGAFVSRFEGERFTAARPRFPAALADRLRRTPTQVLQDRSGEWWAATAEGLFRFAATDRIEELARSSPQARYGVADGLTSQRVYWLFEDAAGDLWIGTAAGPRGALTRRRRVDGAFEALGAGAGLPATGEPTAAGEGPAGTLWIGWSTGELLRGRAGAFTPVPTPPESSPVDGLLFDSRGGLWVATAGGGVLHAADPASPAPAWRRLGVAEGLASDDARCLVEDRAGRVYLGTILGVDRLDPSNGVIRHYTTADGLAQLETTAAFRDRTGALWFGTYSGLSRLMPVADPPRPPPPAWIGGLAIDDHALPVPAVGATALGPVSLAPGPHRVRIDFFAPSFTPGEPVRYEYRLAGRDDASWSPPTEHRSVVLAELAPGSYEFAVRAVDGGGAAAGRAATATLVVPPPWWRRGWFVAAAVVALAAGVLAGHRLRLRRALALERVRTRIAADLHDDLGASLSRISLLAEVARTGADDPRGSGVLDQIGETARGLTGRAREIVWSLNPRYDDLASFAVRLREVAGELLDPLGVAWSLAAPPEAEGRRVHLRPEQRQHLLLVYKEALHNAARHSGAGRVEVELAIRGRRLAGVIADDGRGLVAGAAGSGNGLANMDARVRSLGGELTVDSSPGAGVRIAFSVPLGGRPSRTNMRLPGRHRSL